MSVTEPEKTREFVSANPGGAPAVLQNDSRPETVSPAPAGLRIFSLILCKRPCLYYDAGKESVVWIDDPGPDCLAFVNALRTYADTGPLEARRLYLRAGKREGGESVRLEREAAERFAEKLRELGGAAEIETDDIADYETKRILSMPDGLEEKIYRALTAGSPDAQPPAPDRDHTVYEYIISSEDAPDRADGFVFFKTDGGRGGRTLLRAYSVLTAAQIRKLRKKGALPFYCVPACTYTVRLPAPRRS